MADLNYGGVHQTTVRSTQTDRHIGSFLDVQSADIITGINGYGVAIDVWTPTHSGVSDTEIVYTAPDAASSTTYTIAACTTVAQLAEALGDTSTALGRDVTRWFTVDQTTAACTAKNPGVTGTFTTDGSVTWAHTTTGSEGTDIPIGRLVLLSSLSSAAGTKGVPKVRLPAASTTLNPDSKQVITFVYASLDTGDEIVTTVRSTYLPRATVSVKTQYATSLDATIAAHATALNTALDLGIDAGGLGSGFGVVAADVAAADSITLTADVKGYAFDADSHVINGAAAAGALSSKTYTTGAPGDIDTDIVPSILGVVGRGGQASANSSDDPVVKPLRLAEIARRGVVLVANSQSPAFSDVVWLDPATGLVHNAGASGYIPLPEDRARFTGDYQSSGASVRINFY